MTSSSNQEGGIIASNPAKDYCTLWVVHGTCAAIAWASYIGSLGNRVIVAKTCYWKCLFSQKMWDFGLNYIVP
jgi:hypothetical protein